MVAFVIVANPPSVIAMNHNLTQIDPLRIIFDYSHGQNFDTGYRNVDHLLEGNLTEMGYEVIWAKGGLNSSILEDAAGLIVGSMWGNMNGFQSFELEAIEDWFAIGNKMLWVGCKSDYPGPVLGTGQFVNDNATSILERVGSHAFPEPGEIDDYELNCGEFYRPIANTTSTDPFVAGIVSGVKAVLIHGSTVIYGSNSDTPGENVNPVPLETDSIENLYPLLFSSPASNIEDHDTLVSPYAHESWQIGSFVVCTLEIMAGASKCGVIIVSGTSPYGLNRPMYFDTYYERQLDGYIFVKRAIDVGIRMAQTLATPPETTTTPTQTNTDPTFWSFEMIAISLAVTIGAVAIIGIAFLRRRR